MKGGERARLIGAKMEGNGALMPALRRRDRRGSFPVRRRNQREEEEAPVLTGGSPASVGQGKKIGGRDAGWCWAAGSHAACWAGPSRLGVAASSIFFETKLFSLFQNKTKTTFV